MKLHFFNENFLNYSTAFVFLLTFMFRNQNQYVNDLKVQNVF